MLHTPEMLAQELISVLEETLGYEYGAVLLVEESNGQLIPFALSDQGHGPMFVEGDKSAVAAHTLHLGVGITGWVAQTGQSVCAGDVRQDPRYYGLRDNIRSELCVPLRSGDKIIGVVNVETPRLNAYTETDQHVLETVAAQIATAIQNARLLEQVLASRERLRALSQRLVEVQEAERRQIARELHDEVGQVLTGLKLTLDMAARLPPAQVAGHLDEARAVLNDLMARVRNLSLDLRPTMLDDMGLLPALQWHFERYTGQTGIHVLCRHNGLDRRFPAEVETTVYRIVQEALTNVARYADVRQASVRLLADQEWMRVRIDDQGRGFALDLVRTRATTSGLTGMHERALLLGGELTIESTPGGGTHVIAELPLAR
jgi:signal transduction histidine kinase